ncbi:hypothetical protein [Streptomyces sp. NPDC059862]|uniref:hypothetical protein n=1 Tax=unclassified Streptomyces TaxID=2593676 RepID=UPI00363C61CD
MLLKRGIVCAVLGALTALIATRGHGVNAVCANTAGSRPRSAASTSTPPSRRARCGSAAASGWNRTAEDRTRPAVTDTDPHAWLVLHRPAGDGASGRGLLLLDSVAVPWGVHQEPRGKTVWCELYGDA